MGVTRSGPIDFYLFPRVIVEHLLKIRFFMRSRIITNAFLPAYSTVTPTTSIATPSAVARRSARNFRLIHNMSALKVIHRAEGEGKDYDWGKDHIYIKLSTPDTGGALTLTQDNMKPGFTLANHMHLSHTEIFYILAGQIDFVVAGKPIKATPGTLIYAPEGTPHAASSDIESRMLMFYGPGGFDEMLLDIEKAPWWQKYNPWAASNRDKQFDVVRLSPEDIGPEVSRMRYLAPEEGKSFEDDTGSTLEKLSTADTDGLITIVEQTLNAGAEREMQGDETKILYVLDGEVEYVLDDASVAAKKESTIYFPPGTSTTVKTTSGAKLLVLRIPAESASNN